MEILVLGSILALVVSFVGSLLASFLRATTLPEIAEWRQNHPHWGADLQRHKDEMEDALSAILALRTLGQCSGALIVGYAVGLVLPGISLGLWLTLILFLLLLLFSEMLPRALAATFRRPLAPTLVPLIGVVRWVLWPITLLGRSVVRSVVAPPVPLPQDEVHEQREAEIIQLAERHAEGGALSHTERDVIRNALSLDDVPVSAIMTPRTVVTALDCTMTVGDVFAKNRNISFGRMPVYKGSLDTILGIARRRDLLTAYADDKDSHPVTEFMGRAVFVPESTNVAQALNTLLTEHQKLAVVVDEYGSTVGVVTVEDIVEHLLGREIYEESDPAVDMRALARQRAESRRVAALPGTAKRPAVVALAKEEAQPRSA